ncbi:MAG: glycyl-radical enzyme activating protein [Solobacterium sp.]|nr:glycyl-radical enzyme activating protein [Solobacterium sp.]
MTADRTKTGILFNIQKFSVNDGPGIRTVVFFKGCPLRCRWCSNPESQLTKVQVLWDQKKCIHCHHCIGTCPVQAVSLNANNIHIDHMRCTSCLQCVGECPAHALKAEGETKTVQEVIDTVMQDEVFYEESGGGITLSGGEMLSQPAFAKELLKAAKEEGLHTCCETTGYAKPEVFAGVIEDLDSILFDMKHWDSGMHKEYTGVHNELIIENMKYAASKGKDVLPRIPVIPGFNDSLQDAEQFARLLQETGITKCQLLPFHQFGENKYSLLDIEYAYKDISALHREDLLDYLQVLKDRDIDAFF